MGRPFDTPDSGQMRAAARMYFIEGETRQEIAKKLFIDPRKVTWLLEQARTLGVVRIYIHETVEDDLGTRLQRRYPHLEKVIVVGGESLSGDRLEEQYLQRLRQTAIATADYFDEVVEHNARERPIHVGISGGETLFEFVTALVDRTRNIHVHSLALTGHGTLPVTPSHVDSSTNVTGMWAKSGRLAGHGHYATVLPYGTPPKSRTPRQHIKDQIKMFAANSSVELAIRELDHLDVAFVGIGIMNPKVPKGTLRQRLTMMNLLEPAVSCEELVEEGAVGDISYCLFDERGEVPTKYDWQLFLTAGYYSNHPGIKFYQDMVARHKQVIAIAGPFKVPAIRAALKAKAFNVLITDQPSAQELAAGT